MKMLEDLEEVVRMSDRATSGTVELHTSCSWRRIVSGNRPFLVPTVDPDGHANMDTTASAEFVVSLVNWFRTHHATIADMAKRLEAVEMAVWVLAYCRGNQKIPLRALEAFRPEDAVIEQYQDEQGDYHIVARVKSDPAMQETGR